MRSEAIHQTGTGMHVVHTYRCICSHSRCLTCQRVCPNCGIGQGLDRRGAVRDAVQGSVRLIPLAPEPEEES